MALEINDTIPPEIKNIKIVQLSTMMDIYMEDT